MSTDGWINTTTHESRQRPDGTWSHITLHESRPRNPDPLGLRGEQIAGDRDSEARATLTRAGFRPDPARRFPLAMLEALAGVIGTWGQDADYPDEPCGCLPNDAGAHRVGCPDHPEGVRG